MRKEIAVVALLIIFGAGAFTILSIRFNHGESFPVLSTHRSDPMGMKVLYESLQKINGISVSRNYKDPRVLRCDSSTIFFSGVNIYQLSDSSGLVSAIDSLLSRRNRVVIALDELYIFGKPASFTDSVEKDSDTSFFKWGIQFHRGHSSDTAKIITNDADYNKMIWPGASIKTVENFWTQIVSRHDGMLLGERHIRKGTLVLLHSSFNISNQGLRYNLNEFGTNPLVSYLAGSNKKIIFDEWHNGIKHKASITSLIGRFGLIPVVVFAVFWFLLFVWYRYSQTAPGIKTELLSQDKNIDIDSMKLLFASHVPEKELLNSCIGEWKKSFPARQLPADQGLSIIEKYNSIYKQVAMRPNRNGKTL